MSAATSMPPPVLETPGLSRHESQGRREDRPYALPSRAQSTRSRPSAVAPAPARATSSSHSRPSSRRVEEILPHQDHETSNVASQSRKRSSDRPPSNSRTESTRSGHHRTSSRHYQPSDMTGSSSTAHGGGPAPVVVPLEQKPSGRQGRARTSIPALTGNWILGKTIGAGSMGKVKLAKRQEGGEEVAVKIIPRGSSHDESSQHQSRADRERADRSKEVRTAREAAIVTLLDHPYICGMRDVVRTSHHWYMLFEYVNGGQMLDYIISHGKLKEKQARKFSRQISSALDYCHRNSIVHRDLKIENILISKTGDIKIIDFGLSNLFAPKGYLKTFCGSLYFAAPELLQAKAYTGPEVDVWSFGIVLYVLVCGKVPFDDQSMQALHAKIKKGVVDYPNWLTSDCRDLISRMLVTDPKQRASLQEIMNHPWMLKGFGFPPENHLPLREPVQLPLDESVINAMTGFDFGPADLIKTQLTDIIESEEYRRACRVLERERASIPKDVEKKRSFGFDFYKRRSSTTSRDTLTTPSSEGLSLGNDPVNAYHPLISVYYLVREKQGRDHKRLNPGAISMPRTPNEAPLQMKMPEIAPPKAAYTNSGTYEMPGEKPTGGRSRPRARTHGEDEVIEGVKNMKIRPGSPSTPAISEPLAEPLKKESTATSILRRFSTRRRKEAPERPADKYYPPAVTVRAPNETQSALRKSFSIRGKSREKEAEGETRLRSGSSQPDHRNLLSPPRSAGEARPGSKIGRSTSVNSAELRRRHGQRDASPRAEKYGRPGPNESEQSIIDSVALSANEKALRTANQNSPAAAMRAKSLGHARRESIQARRARREQEGREANVPEETDAELAESEGASRDNFESADNVKPGYLKGLFSVSTTSTKPVKAIRADLIRVLKQLNLEHEEIRGGFHCKWSPSIDLKKVADVPQSNSNLQSPSRGHSRRISFGGLNFGGDKTQDRGDDFNTVERAPTKSSRRREPAPADKSYTNSDASDESLPRDTRDSRRAVGETSTRVQSDLGGSMVLEFEIFVVKVLPIMQLHGIQFKRLSGNTWQYKNMAEQILKELRL